MKNNVVLAPSYWASVSGGKDSLYMLNLILANPQKYPLNGVVYFDLENDFPFIKNAIKFMKERCEKINIPFYEIKPSKSWNECYNEWGYPTRHRRWCNSQYKMNASKQLENFLKNNGFELYTYVGLCADEIKRVKNDKHKIYPLIEEGIEEKYIWFWAKEQDIFNDFYKYNYRCGCIGCPLSDHNNLKYTSIYYPTEFKYYMNLAHITEQNVFYKTGKPISVWQGNAKYNTEYIVNRLKTKELKVLTTWKDGSKYEN